MRQLQEKKKIEVEQQTKLELEKDPGFKFRIKNLRKTAYITNFPEESDYFKYKIGDYITKYNAQSPIYEVVAIERKSITEYQSRDWDTRLTRYNTDHFAITLIAEYVKNGNFGVCQITMKPVLRGDKDIVKGKFIKFLEIDHIRSINYKCYKKTDLQAIVTSRDYVIKRWSKYLTTYQAKLDREILLKEAVIKLKNSKSQLSMMGSTIGVEQAA